MSVLALAHHRGTGQDRIAPGLARQRERIRGGWAPLVCPESPARERGAPTGPRGSAGGPIGVQSVPAEGFRPPASGCYGGQRPPRNSRLAGRLFPSRRPARVPLPQNGDEIGDGDDEQRRREDSQDETIHGNPPSFPRGLGGHRLLVCPVYQITNGCSVPKGYVPFGTNEKSRSRAWSRERLLMTLLRLVPTAWRRSSCRTCCPA